MADLQGRSLTWAFIVYPESLPDNWLDYLRELHTMGAISPLHDKDVNPDGEIKKAHYHILLKFPTKKSPQQIYKYCRDLGSNVFPEPVDNFEGYLRYLIHIDNPEKYQYDENDITPLCGLDIHSYFAPSKSRAAAITYEIVQFLFDHESISEFDVLLALCMDKKDWAWCLINTPCFGVTRILNSRRFRLSNKKKDEEKDV